MSECGNSRQHGKRGHRGGWRACGLHRFPTEMTEHYNDMDFHLFVGAAMKQEHVTNTKVAKDMTEKLYSCVQVSLLCESSPGSSLNKHVNNM